MSLAASLMRRRSVRPTQKEEPMSPLVCSFGLCLVLLGAGAGYAAPQDDARSAPTETPEQQPLSIDWKVGPTQADIGKVAGIKVPERFRFTGAAGTRQLMERMGNPTSDE